PQPDTVLSKSLPVEAFARVLLAVRRHVAVRDNIPRRNGMARQNAEAQIARRGELQYRKVAIAPFVARIDDLDADRARVQLAVAAPPRHPGMPGAPLFRHQAQHTAIL